MSNVGSSVSYRKDPKETTEWDDILREKGILAPLEHTSSEESEPESEHDELADKTLEQLAELEEEEYDDSRVLESYRQARLAAMKAARSAAKFGSMTHLSRADFVREVTDASKDAWVIVLLYKDSIDASRMLEEAMVHAAEKFRAVKFMKIVADQCIENYPDSNVPSVLVYHDGEMVTTQVGINGPFGGAPVRVIDIEYWLYELGAVETELEDDPRVAKRERARVHRAEGSARAAFGDDFE